MGPNYVLQRTPGTSYVSTYLRGPAPLNTALDGMSWKATLVHALLCLAIGAAVASVSEVKWLAAAFWASAVLYFTASFAYVEDAQPGGFDNPSETVPLPIAKGLGALKFWAGSLAVCAALVSGGY